MDLCSTLRALAFLILAVAVLVLVCKVPAKDLSDLAMTAIVRTTYRYRRPQRRKPKGPVIEGPRIVHAKTPKPGRVTRRAAKAERSLEPSVGSDTELLPSRNSALVTIRRRKHATLSHLLDDMPPEEHKRRGDAADALFREMQHRIVEKARS